MNRRALKKNTSPDALGSCLAGLSQPDHMHTGPISTVRQDDFEGHHISIKTTYDITVDGKPLHVHIGLSNDGSAHCHGLPAYQFTSVVDLVKALIAYFPDEFGPSEPDQTQHGGGHAEHRHGHPKDM